MKSTTTILLGVMLLLLMSAHSTSVEAQESATVNCGVDLVSRYIWRGLNIGDAPSIQPSLAVAYAGFELGAWGAYSTSNNATATDEIDFWLSYTHQAANSISFTVIATDYTFPNSGVKFFNFNDYDDDDGPGAHTLEIGAGITGPQSFPIGFYAYMNVYNDAGNNTYFQVDYPVTVGETGLNFFAGAAGGAEDNPGYYGTDDFQVVHLGVTATKKVKISGDFSLPVFVTYSLNPEEEISYLLLGFSL